MAARRTGLARPFVLTAAFFPLACHSSGERPAQSAEASPTAAAAPASSASASSSSSTSPTSAPVASSVASSVASAAASSPPSEPPAQPPTVADRWTLVQEEGKCVAVPVVNCAVGSPCPTRKPYECPKSVLRYPAHVARSGAECKATFPQFSPTPCPPKTKCNPPPPVYVSVKVDCP